MLRRLLLSTSRSGTARRLLVTAPAGRAAVARYVAGETPQEAVRAVQDLCADGLMVTVDHIGEDILDRAQATQNRDAYLTLLAQLSDAGLSAGADVSIKLSALGQALPGSDELVYDHAAAICAAAREVGATMTLDMEDHTTTDATLATLARLRADVPSVGVALQAYLRRTEGDCRDLAHAGSRVRLCKGAYAEPPSVAYQRRAEITAAYLRDLDILLAGGAHPMIATHDPRIVAEAVDLTRTHQRTTSTYEFQMLYGIRPAEQLRLCEENHPVRVYVPFGTDWYGYFVRRLAERPANVRLLVRSLVTRT